MYANLNERKKRNAIDVSTYTTYVYITQGHICCYFKHQTGRQYNTLRRKKQLPHVTRQRPVHTCMHKQNPTNKTELRLAVRGGATKPHIVNSASSNSSNSTTTNKELNSEYIR